MIYRLGSGRLSGVCWVRCDTPSPRGWTRAQSMCKNAEDYGRYGHDKNQFLVSDLGIFQDEQYKKN